MKKLLIIWLILLMCGSVVFAGFNEKDKLLASDGAGSDNFGQSVGLSGDYAIIGAWRDNSAYIFKRNGTNWIEQDILPSSVGSEDFGISVAIDGDYAVIGAQRNNSYQGAAYVFKRDAGLETWSVQAMLTASGGVGNDRFGGSVAIDGDIVVVGAFGDTSNTGAVYVFVKPGGGWTSKTEDAKLTASDAATSDQLGGRVSINGDVVVAGARFEDAMGNDSGSAYVFTKPGGGWSSKTEDGKLTASDGAADDEFGFCVAIYGDTIAIGSVSDDPSGSQSGSAYVFTKPGGGWTTMTEDGKLTASDGSAVDLFGYSIAVYQDVILVGAYYHEFGVTDTGAAYVFNRPGGSWTTMTEDEKLTASDGASMDGFGGAVSIGGLYALIGAPTDDNGNGVSAGGAYVFSICDFYLAGDLKVDCKVNLFDFAIMAMNWLIDCNQAPVDPACVAR